MFMWRFFLLYALRACEVRMKELNIFPIKEENYVLPVKGIFSGYNLSFTCTNCPENVYMKNTFYPLNEKENYEYTSISISSNVTHFASLTTQNTLNIYNKNLELIQSIELPISAKCFNAIFLISQQILLDCYVGNQLQFQILDQQNLVINQNFSTELPLSTQLISFLSNEQQTLLYAQYYRGISYMTLFVQNGTQFYNATVLNHNVIDFSITQKGFIYVLSAHLGICQVIVDSQFQFITLTQHDSVQNIIKIFSHSSYHLNSQYDTIIVVNDDYDVSIQYFLATQGQIYFMGDFNQVQFDFKNSSYIWVGISDYFLIIQQNNFFTVFSGIVTYTSTQRNITVYLRNRSSTNQIYTYFNPNDNIIYEFNDKIVVSSIQNPQLIGKFSEKQSEKIKISASEIQLPFINVFCEVQINYQVVDSNDSNIYLVYNKKLPLFLLQDSTIQYILDNFSGPLQQINVQVQDSSLASFIDITFQKVNFTFNQNFELTKMFYFNEFYEKGYFFAGVVKNNLLFYFCYPTYCKEFFQTQFEQQIRQIEISFYQLSTILLAINQGDESFYIFQINYHSDLQFYSIQIGMIEISSYAFKSFILMYQNIIVLTQTNKLQIIANNGYISHEIDEKEINKLFKTDLSQQITFTPKQIISNQQNQATFIVVNNINSFIILGVTYQNQFIPMSFTQTQIEIEQINLINNQLIITYINQNQLCFQVYKLYNLYAPEFQKPLRCANFSNGWQVQSDNIHLYVQTNQNNEILVYSPAQPYHTSLYYQIYGTLFSCINQRSKSFVYISQNLYQLYTDFLVKFESSNSLQNSYIQNTQQIVSVNSQLNQDSIVQVNDSLSIINTFTQIDKLTTYTYQIQKLENITIDINKIVNYQIISYNGYQKQSSPDFQCEFNYFFSSQKNMSCSGYSVVISYQNQIILQNESQLYLPLLNEQQYVNYNFNFTKCIISIIVQNQLYSVCENIDFIYLITFNISNNYSFTLIQYLQLPFTCENIIKFVQYENLTIILGQNVIASIYHYIYIYNIYNQLNITYYNISCLTGVQDFAFQYLFNDDGQGQVFAFFYICQNQLFYKLGYLNLNTNEFSLDYNQHQIIDNGKKFKIFNYTQLLQIVTLEVNTNEILLLLTTTNIINIFFTMTFSRQLYVKNQLQLSGLIQSIPPYGKYNLTYSAFAENGMLVLLFYNSTDRVYAVYNYSNLQYSLDIPLIMIGGISQQLPLPQSVSLMYNQTTKEGWLFDITNGSLYSYQLNQANYLNCQTSKALKSNQYYYVDISNSFSLGTMEFIFEYDEQQSYFWIYLLVIIVLTSIFALIYIFSRKKEQQQKFNLELNFEL